jgi:Protein of unknown function (DUF2793)
MTQTDVLKFTYLEAAQAQKHVTVNENFAMVDVLTQIKVIGMFVNTPPGSPTGGDCYIVGGTPTGAWVGKAYKIAHSLNGTWRFYDNKPGMQVFLTTENRVYTCDTAFQWIPEINQSSVTTQFDKTSNTTFTDVTGLSVSLGVGTFAFEAYIPVAAGVLGGVKLALSGTAVISHCVATGQAFNGASIGNSMQSIATSGSPTGTLAAYTGVTTDILVKGTIIVTTAGSLALRFAQNVSDSTPSSVLKGARLSAQRI